MGPGDFVLLEITASTPDPKETHRPGDAHAAWAGCRAAAKLHGVWLLRSPRGPGQENKWAELRKWPSLEKKLEAGWPDLGRVGLEASNLQAPILWLGS